MGTTQSQFGLMLNLIQQQRCVSVCVFVLCAAGRLQSDAAFGEPSLRPVELPQPPVLPLLEHADDVALWEA